MAHAHCSINAFILSCVAAFAIAGTAACQNTAKGVQQDVQQAEEQTRDERAEVSAAARDLSDDVARAADRTGSAAENAGDELAERAGAMWQTIDVKGAIMADPSVNATRLNVDTNYETKTVTLNGSVPTETERDMAEVIAKARADGYTVVNNLQVITRGQN